MILGITAITAVALATAQAALYIAGQRTTGPLGPAAELGLNLVVDMTLLSVVRFPRLVALLAVLVTAVFAVGAGLSPGTFVPVPQLNPAIAPLATPAIVWFLVYLLPRSQAVTGIVTLALLAIPAWAPTWTMLYLSLSATILPAVLALYIKARTELLSSLRKRADLADVERCLLAEQAETAERQRLAAELHDIVTHHVTEIVLHADALRVTTREDQARVAAEQIRQAGARTLTELRDLMALVTSGNEPPPAARPDYGTGGDLAALAEADGARLEVTGDCRTVPPVVARAVHRVVQESLTNARKHAPGARIHVTIDYPGDRVDVEVANSTALRTADPTLTSAGSGMGLAGLDRRVSLLGGTFTAREDGDGGFTVTASIPAASPAVPAGRGQS
ncbi:sensor histidine kinase [Streptosporangium canum]|uniref:sensor histidine kinase n=1 Tax=Streptosporangium canum TaxID=324952 RepID=UPI0037AE7066